MKIANSSAQKGNMRSAHKKSPSNDKKNGKEQTSGKKLVQARLPFKILSGTPPSTAPEEGSSSVKLEVPPKKRKLSYTEEPENPKKIGKSDSKENATIEKLETSIALDMTEDVIVLDDEDSIDEVIPKTPAITPKAKKISSSTTRNAVNATTRKVQIKLPLSGKKKKRKSHRLTQSPKREPSDISDVELLSEELQNPTKKAKIAEDSTVNHVEIVNFDDKEDVDADMGVNEEGSATTPKGKKSNLKSDQKVVKNKKHSEDKTVADDDDSKCNPKNQNNSLKKQPEDESVYKSVEVEENLETNDNIEAAEKSKSSPKKQNSPTKSLPVKAKDLKSETDKFITPTRSRRSTRQAEVETKKEEECSEQKLSPDVEFVSENSSGADTSINESAKKMLTPKQLKLMEQRNQARKEKELKIQQQKEERDRKIQEQREERERKIQEEKLQKQKEREEKELQRKKERDEKEEQKRREKEEKEEQRRKEKEDKERKRLAEIEVKNEEKRKKDEVKEEERRKKEDERRRKELEKEEEENKKKKAAQAFTKFFVPKVAKPLPDDDQESREDAESVDSLAFRPFQVKGDMKLAPLVRREFRERSREKLDSFLKSIETDKAGLYIGELKKGKHIPLIGSRTVLKENDDDDVLIIENELETAAQTIYDNNPKSVQKYKAKFYSFRENRRPPFYGTWRKKSTVITPRKPFSMDKAFFDYEVDSDDEWEEEEPGESLNGSEDEKDESEDEDYEVDNEWFVPHGHLSDEEMQNEDELGPDTSREMQKAKLKALQHEFAQEMKKKTEKIKPRLIGAIWEDENGNRPNLCPAVIWDSLCSRAMMFCDPIIVEEPEPTIPEPSTPPPEKQKRIKFNDELISDLVRLLHGNRHSKVFLIKEYMEHVSKTCESIVSGECLAPTKSQIREKIDEVSEWSVVDANSSKKKNKKKLCWVVAADVLDKYSLNHLGLRNEWIYTLQAKYDVERDCTEVTNETPEETAKEIDSTEPQKPTEKNNRKSTSGITKFAKVLTKEEKQNQLTGSQKTISASPNITAKNSPKTVKSKTSPKAKVIEKQATPTAVKPPPQSSKSSSPSNKIPVVKKRVALLMSVPPGQQFSPASKNALISKFLQKTKKAEEKTVSPTTVVTSMDVDEVVVLD